MVIVIGGLSACGQGPSLVSPSPTIAPSPSSYSQELEEVNLDDIGDAEIVKMIEEFSGTDSLDAFDAELSQVDVTDGTDQLLSKIEEEL